MSARAVFHAQNALTVWKISSKLDQVFHMECIERAIDRANRGLSQVKILQRGRILLRDATMGPEPRTQQ